MKTLYVVKHMWQICAGGAWKVRKREPQSLNKRGTSVKISISKGECGFPNLITAPYNPFHSIMLVLWHFVVLSSYNTEVGGCLHWCCICKTHSWSFIRGLSPAQPCSQLLPSPAGLTAWPSVFSIGRCGWGQPSSPLSHQGMPGFSSGIYQYSRPDSSLWIPKGEL